MTSTPAASESVLFDVQDGVGLITLNQPDKLNAMTRAMAARTGAILYECRARDDVRALVLTGAGAAFCAGAQLSGARDGSAAQAEDRFTRKMPIAVFADVTRAIVDVDKPVIAALSGPAVGAGLSYATACDRRIGDKTVRMAAIFVRRGLHPDCGISFFLPRLVGLPMALHMVETGIMLDAERARTAGLLDEVVEQGMALQRAIEYAAELARGPSLAVDLARRAIYRSLTATLDEMLYFEGFGASVANRSNDAAEGIRAFLERREPRFQGD